jgi:hypothetical protein
MTPRRRGHLPGGVFRLGPPYRHPREAGRITRSLAGPAGPGGPLHGKESVRTVAAATVPTTQSDQKDADLGRDQCG